MFGNVIGGITSFLAFRFDMTQALSTWLVGHFSLVLRGNYELVYLVVPLIAAAWIYAKWFNIVGMGKDFSKNLGVNYSLVLFAGLSDRRDDYGLRCDGRGKHLLHRAHRPQPRCDL